MLVGIRLLSDIFIQNAILVLSLCFQVKLTNYLTLSSFLRQLNRDCLPHQGIWHIPEMSSAWKHSTVVSSYDDFGYLLGIIERGSGKLGFSCITITLSFFYKRTYISYLAYRVWKISYPRLE